MADKEITLKNKLMFGMGDLCGGGASLLIGMLFLDFLTSPAVGLGAKGLISAGTIMLVGKLCGGILNIVFGHWSDRTRSRFGRRRRYFLWAAGPIFVGFALMWNPYLTLEGTPTAKFLFFLITYMIYCLSFSMAFVNYISILPDMTDDYRTRSSMIGYKAAFGGLSAVISSIIPIVLIQNMENLTLAYAIISAIYATLYSLPWVFVFFGTFERKDIVFPGRKFDPIGDLRSAFKNKAYRNFLLIYLSCNATGDFLMALIVFYLKFYLLRYDDFTTVAAILLLINLVTVPIYTKIANKKGKTAPLKIGGVFVAIGMLAALFLQPDAAQPEIWLYAVVAFASIGISACNIVPMSILQDIADVDELISTKRRGAMFSSYASAIRQIMLGFIGFFISQALGFGSFEGGVDWQTGTQPGSAILVIRLLFSLMPLLCFIFAYIGAFTYKLSVKRHRILVDELERLRAGGKMADANPAVQRICEEISGLPYKQCWNPANAELSPFSSSKLSGGAKSAD